MTNLDHIVDVGVQILVRDIQYDAYINYAHALLPVKPHDLESWSDELRYRVEAIAHDISFGATPATVRNHLEDLAEFGHAVWKKLFCCGSDLNEAGKILCAHLAREPFARIEIVSEDFALPWDLLYDRSLMLPFRPEGFWGFRSIVSRLFNGKEPAAFRPKRIVTAQPVIGLCADDTLSGVRTEEIPFLKGLAEKGSVQLARLQPLDPTHKVESLGNLRRFLAGNLDIVHFACHAEADPATPQGCFLQIARQFPVRPLDLSAYDVEMQNGPLVILNACQTGRTSSLYTTSLVRTLMEAGARSVIATECALPDHFAAEFARLFYEHFLEGDSIGEALFRTRWHFLASDNNPLGLLYALYGYALVRLAPTSIGTLETVTSPFL